MRAVTRAVVVLMMGGAVALSAASVAEAAPCPRGTYPPGQSCVTHGGTTHGQPSGPTTPGATTHVVTGQPGEAQAPPSSKPVAAGSQSSSGTPTKSSSASTVAFGTGAGALLLLLALFFLVSRRRRGLGPDAA